MPYSEYNYIQPSELPTYIHSMSSVTDEALAAKFISDAEHIVDAYVGAAPKFYPEFSGEVLASTSGTIVSGSVFGSRRPNYWAQGGLYIELVDNVASGLVGQARLIVASNDNQVTLASGFGATVPAGATFVIEQRSAFPRLWDQNALGVPDLPSELKRAVAFQVEYGIQFGSEAFGLGDASIADGEASVIQSRTYGSGYSESRIPGMKQELAYFLAPRARAELRRLLNVLGKV